ncbi:MAG TPA: hypothetical protein ACHBX0_06520 [Arsenophonus sp.]
MVAERIANACCLIDIKLFNHLSLLIKNVYHLLNLTYCNSIFWLINNNFISSELE